MSLPFSITGCKRIIGEGEWK